jgi:hypothetical protein
LLPEQASKQLASTHAAQTTSKQADVSLQKVLSRSPFGTSKHSANRTPKARIVCVKKQQLQAESQMVGALFKCVRNCQNARNSSKHFAIAAAAAAVAAP